MLSLIYPQINHEIDKENNFYDREYSSHIAAFVPNNIVCVHSTILFILAIPVILVWLLLAVVILNYA